MTAASRVGAVLGLAATLGCAGSPATPPASPGDAEHGTRNAERSAPDPGRDARLAQALAELGDPAPAKRDRALETLVTMGDPAVPALKRARDATPDPEARTRLDRALEVLGEEGAYVTAVTALRAQDYRAAREHLDRYLRFARGRYRGQAEYLHGETIALQARQAVSRATTGDAATRGSKADPKELWLDAAHHHNVYLFFRSRGVTAEDFHVQALAAYDAVLARTPEDRRGWACVAALHAIAGSRAQAEAAWTRAQALPVTTGWDLMDDAAYHAAAGDLDAAFASLGAALPRCREEERLNVDADRALRWVRTSNDFDALRADPRFADLVGEGR